MSHPMRNRKALWMGLLLAHPAFAADLHEAYRSALQRTESERIQEAQQAQTEEHVKQARGGLLPTISLSGVYTRQDRPSTVTTNAFTRPDQRSVRVVGTQPVFKGFREYAGLRQTEALNRAQESLVLQNRLTVYSSVGQAFYGVAAAEQDLRDLRELLDLSRKREVEIAERVRIGRSRQGDLLSAQSQVASVEAQVQVAEVTLEQARDTLLYVTGLERTTRLDLDKEPPLPEKLAPQDTYLPKLGTRPDIQAQRESLTAADEAVSVARGAHLPSVDLNGNYYLDRTGVLADTKWDFSVAATLPLFQGGVVQSQVREAAQKRTVQELTLSQAERTARRDLQLAWDAADGALAQIRSLAVAREVSERNYREQQKDYRLGLVTNLDVLAALNNYQENKRAYDRARFQARSALVTLSATIGEVP